MSSINEQFTVVMSKKKAPKPEVKVQTRQELMASCARKTADHHFICRVCKKAGTMCADEIDNLSYSLELKGIAFQLPTKHKECKQTIAAKVKVAQAPAVVEAPVVVKAPVAQKQEDFPELPAKAPAPTKAKAPAPAPAPVVPKSKELLELEAELEVLRKEAEMKEREAPLIAAAKAEIARLKAAAAPVPAPVPTPVKTPVKAPVVSTGDGWDSE